MRGHEDLVMLCSTTGSYGRPILEVAYGEFLYFTPPRLYGRGQLRKSGWGVGMLHRPCSAYPGQHQCGLNYIIFYFFYFKTYMYYTFKIYIYCMKEHWWSLTSSWPDEVQRMFSTAHEFSKKNLNHRQFYERFI